ncbi:FKBP-type peptidyl-prolyl cis-trans isomerase [Enterobacter hormaechei]|nr:FKBP-type peptidyl-prolyl cis-trans isomerase [Enterobacter hormaechei]
MSLMRRVMVTTLWSASALLMGVLAKPCVAAGEGNARTDSGATTVTAPASAAATATTTTATTTTATIADAIPSDAGATADVYQATGSAKTAETTAVTGAIKAAKTTGTAGAGARADAAAPTAGVGQAGSENPTAAARERENERKNQAATDDSPAASTPGASAATQTDGTAPNSRTDRAPSMAEQLSALSATLSATQVRLDALTRQQAGSGTVPATPPGDEAGQRAYASGVMLGRELLRSIAEQQRVGLVLPVSQVLLGLEDSVNRRPLQLDETTLAQQLAALDRDFTQRQREGLARQEADGRAYMAAFLAQPHSVRQRGSAYRIEGSGTLPRLRRTDLMTVNMTVRLPDGTEIDQRGENGQAAQVRVDALMPAVTDALLHVGAGGRLTVVVAPERAYGKDGLPPDIPGGATLIVDIRVLGIKRS